MIKVTTVTTGPTLYTRPHERPLCHNQCDRTDRLNDNSGENGMIGIARISLRTRSFDRSPA